jgi:hypothetical protein
MIKKFFKWLFARARRTPEIYSENMVPVKDNELIDLNRS